MYDVNYFKTFISRIPESDIGEGFIEEHCILHHLGVKPRTHYQFTDLALALARIFMPLFPLWTKPVPGMIWEINDGTVCANDQLLSALKDLSPKQRLLFALDIVEQMQSVREMSLSESIISILLTHQTRDY